MMQTIRKGDKRYGEGFVDITDDDGNKITDGYVYASYMWRLIDIPKEEIRLSHDPECQTRQGLFDTMQKYYPDFEEDDWITIIFFSADIY